MKSWQMRGENIQKLRVLPEDGTLFAPANLFRLKFSRTGKTPSVVSTGHGLHEIADYEVIEEK